MQLWPSRQLYNYWNEIRRNRIAPRRSDIEPSRIGGLLGKAFVLEQTSTYSFRYRIAGSQLCDAFAIEFRDTDFLAHFFLNDRLAFMRHLSLITDNGAVLVADIEASPENERRLRLPFEFVLMPLANPQDVIDRVLGIASCAKALHVEGGRSGEGHPLTRWRMRRVRTIWNDQDGLTDVAQDPGKFPEDPSETDRPSNSRQGRLAIRNRRKFRVYDGGILHLRNGDGS